MKRKVIKQAGSAYTLTLPIEWVRANGVSEKSEVDVSIDGKKLVIFNEALVGEKKAKIDVSGFDKRSLHRYINALYAIGVDEIEINSDRGISSDLIHSSNSLIGYALVAKEDRKYIMKDIGGLSKSDLDEIFKRVFQAVILFYSSAIEDIFGEQKQTVEKLRMRDLEVNKLCLYLQRAISKMTYDNPIRGRIMFTFSYELERLGDDILRFWNASILKKIKKRDASLRELSDLSLQCLEGAFDLYYSFDSKRSEKLFETRNKLRRKINSMEVSNELVGYVLRIAEGAVDLSHLSLMMNLE